jgi:hypothetical protein
VTVTVIVITVVVVTAIVVVGVGLGKRSMHLAPAVTQLGLEGRHLLLRAVLLRLKDQNVVKEGGGSVGCGDNGVEY